MKCVLLLVLVLMLVMQLRMGRMRKLRKGGRIPRSSIIRPRGGARVREMAVGGFTPPPVDRVRIQPMRARGGGRRERIFAMGRGRGVLLGRSNRRGPFVTKRRQRWRLYLDLEQFLDQLVC